MDRQSGHVFSQYLHWVVGNFGKIIADVKESRKFEYQIIGWKKGKNVAGDRLVMRVVGTHTDIPLTPIEIYEDDELIKGFSPPDVKLIATLGSTA